MVNSKYRWLAALLHNLVLLNNQSFFENRYTSPVLLKNKNARIHFIFKPIQPTSMDFFCKNVCYNGGKHELNPN